MFFCLVVPTSCLAFSHIYHHFCLLLSKYILCPARHQHIFTFLLNFSLETLVPMFFQFYLFIFTVAIWENNLMQTK